MIRGIDLNSRSVALVSHTGRGFLLKKHTVKPTKYPTLDRASVLAELHSFVVNNVDPDDLVYVESPIVAGARNIQSTVKVAAAYGAVLAAISLRQATAIDVAVSSWKVATVGNGSASKLDVSQWLHRLHASVHIECAGDQDLMDAVCIALYGQQHAERSARISGRHLLHQAEVPQHP